MMRYRNRAVQRVCWLFVLALAVSACATITPSTTITRSNAEELFVLGEDFVYDDGSTHTINLYCTVFEGLRCYFLPHERSETFAHRYDPVLENEASAIIEELSKTIILDMDFKIVEHSLLNTVQIRCRRQSAHHEIRCEYNRGGEWERLPVD